MDEGVLPLAHASLIEPRNENGRVPNIVCRDAGGSIFFGKHDGDYPLGDGGISGVW